MIIKKLITGPLGINTYIIVDGGEAAVVDAGGNGEEILSCIDQTGAQLKYLLLTHGHFDHIGAAKFLQDAGAKVVIGAGDENMLKSNSENMGKYFGAKVEALDADVIVGDGDEIVLGSKKIKVIATPGHTPGGVSYFVENVLFSGDTLFALSVGRSDFKGGNTEALLRSIREKLFVLPEETKVFPGHNEETDILSEKKYNPFAKL